MLLDISGQNPFEQKRLLAGERSTNKLFPPTTELGDHLVVTRHRIAYSGGSASVTSAPDMIVSSHNSSARLS